MVGDSITLGGSAPAGSQMVDLLRSGDTPLAFEALQAGFSGSSMDTDWSVNSGNPRRNCIYGTCYQTVLEPLYPYTLVHVLLGTNDAIGYYQPGPSDVPTTEAEYKAALENFVGFVQAKDATVKVIVSKPPYRADYAIPSATNDLIDDYADAIDEVVAADGLVLAGCDMRTLLDIPDDFEAGPGAHPDGSGHAKIAACLEPIIEAALP